MLNQLSNPNLRIRAFGLILSLLMGAVQTFATLMITTLHSGTVSVDAFLTLFLSTLFALCVGQLVLTVFIRRGLESILAWLAAIAGMLVYGVFDTAMVALVEQKTLMPLARGLLIFGIRMTANVLWMYGVWLGATLFLLSQQRVAEERQRTLMLERAQFETRLSFLESQINPHFLFNALNTVASLIVLDRAGDARTAIIHLGHLLRRSLNGEGNPLATLADEIEAAKAYLTIEKLRFADRLAVEWDIQAGLEDTSLPRFSLQPLIENVVKHAVAHVDGEVQARICARRGPGRVEISVWNDGIAGTAQGADVLETGVGLRNLRQRLHLLYAGQAVMTVRRPATDEFECRLTVPVEILREAAE